MTQNTLPAQQSTSFRRLLQFDEEEIEGKNPGNKQLKEAAVNASISEERNSLVMSVVCRPDAAIASEGYATKY